MTGKRHRLAPRRGRSIYLVSVLALLALACFPLSAQAVIPEYHPEDPSKATSEIPTRNEPPAKISNTPDNNAAGDSNSSDHKSSSSEEKPSGIGGGSSKDGGKGQSSPTNGSTSPKNSAEKPIDSSATADDSSSPLVPILIALAVLAAISIGAVVIRQRRQRRGPDARVSPEAS